MCKYSDQKSTNATLNEVERLTIVRQQAREVASEIGGVANSFSLGWNNENNFECDKAHNLCKLCGVDFRSSADQFPATSRCFEMVVHWSMILLLLLVSLAPLVIVQLSSAAVAHTTFLVVFLCTTSILYLPHHVIPTFYDLLTRKYPDKPAAEHASYQHVVSLAVYKETIGVVAAGLQALNTQPQANRIHLVVCMEEGSGSCEEKYRMKQQITAQLGNLGWVRFYEHPKGMPNHIPGNGSNIHNGMKCFLMDFERQEEIKNWIYTKLDAQMILEHGYFSALEHKYDEWMKIGDSHKPTIWQPMVLHTIHAEEAWSVSLNFTVSISVLTMTTLPMGAAFCQYAMPLTQLISAGLQTPHLIAEDGAIAFQCDPSSYTGAILDSIPRCAFKAPVLGNNFIDAMLQLQTQERRFGGGGFWLLPTQVSLAPSMGKLLWFLRFFFRFWVAMGGTVFFLSSVAAFYLMDDDIPTWYANHYTFSSLYVAIPILLVNPAFEYMLTQRWSKIHQQIPLSAKKILFRFLLVPLYQIIMVIVEWIILIEVACTGSAGQKYKPRAKKANTDLEELRMEGTEGTMEMIEIREDLQSSL